jgi:hypothetical protein
LSSGGPPDPASAPLADGLRRAPGGRLRGRLQLLSGARDALRATVGLDLLELAGAALPPGVEAASAAGAGLAPPGSGSGAAAPGVLRDPVRPERLELL